MTITSVPCVQQSLRHVSIKTLYKVHVISSIKMSTVDSETVQDKGLGRKTEVDRMPVGVKIVLTLR